MSPAITILHIPEKLVLEVRATGQYDFIDWTRNRDLQGISDFNPTIQQLPHFNEIYVKQTTNATDLGVYEVTFLPPSPIRAMLLVIASGTYIHIFSFEVCSY